MLQVIDVGQTRSIHHPANWGDHMCVRFHIFHGFLHFGVRELLQLVIMVDQQIEALSHSLADDLIVIPL